MYTMPIARLFFLILDTGCCIKLWCWVWASHEREGETIVRTGLYSRQGYASVPYTRQGYASSAQVS